MEVRGGDGKLGSGGRLLGPLECSLAWRSSVVAVRTTSARTPTEKKWIALVVLVVLAGLVLLMLLVVLVLLELLVLLALLVQLSPTSPTFSNLLLPSSHLLLPITL